MCYHLSMDKTLDHNTIRFMLFAAVTFMLAALGSYAILFGDM